MCQDSCPYASDGTCDDGGSESTYVLCEVASDCADCGPRLSSRPLATEPSQAQPLSHTIIPASSAHLAPPAPPFSPALALTQRARGLWDTIAHPVWMISSGLYTCWHAALYRPLVGLGACCFFAGALVSVGLSLCTTLLELALQTQRIPGCCACSVFYMINYFPSIRAEAVFWLGVSLPSVMSIASVLRYFWRGSTRESA